MTQLPATMVEAEARAYARTWIVETADLDPFELGVPIANQSYGPIWLRRELKNLARSHPTNMMSVVDYARAGWDVADEVLRELAIETMDRGDKLPTLLAAYTMETVRGPPKPRGPRKEVRSFQDILIAGLTADLILRYHPDLKPMRSSASRRVSACDIVADAVREAGISRLISYKQAENIWLRWGRWLLPTAHPLAPN